MLFRSRHKPRVCVIGLDGVPIGLLRRLAADGVMPRTAAIVNRGGPSSGSASPLPGGLRAMRASLPPVSSVSWTCFMTGANPAEHGIFGFTDVSPDSYQLRFPTFSDVKTPTMWDRLGERNLRCCVINQPSTYPAREIPGALVSGFVALQLEKSVWPKDHLPALRRMNYRIDVDTKDAREKPDGLLGDLMATHAARVEGARYFWQREQWDYFQAVVTGTDRLHHFLWNAVVEADHPLHRPAMSYYQSVDTFIGEMWDRFHKGRPADREGEGFVLLSDHGFTGVRYDVRLNAWLRQQGYLEYAKDDPTSVADIAAQGTRAFCLDPGRIYLNVKGRFAQGCVEPGDAPALRAEIAGKLPSLTRDGQPVIRRVFTREEAFHGPLVSQAPDLVAISRDGFDLKGTTRGQEVFAATHFQGMHTWEDAFIWTTLPIPDDPDISQLAAPIVSHLRAEQ
jgi:predicted AlkP superfamily phosphohydrolase/phosphomutase